MKRRRLGTRSPLVIQNMSTFFAADELVDHDVYDVNSVTVRRCTIRG